MGKLPSKPRPAEIGQWFCLGWWEFTRKAIPTIESVQTYKDEWVKWWTKAQLEWRNVERWPFSQDNTGTGDWGDLFSSGKDGLYIVIMSLSWWVHTLDLGADSKVYEAISDVSWVMEHIITSLSADTIVGDSLPPATPLPPAKCCKSFKVGPPTKRRKEA